MVVHAIHFDAATLFFPELARHFVLTLFCWVMLVRAGISSFAVSIAPMHARLFRLPVASLRRNVLRFLRLLFFVCFIQFFGCHYLHLICESLHLILEFL